MNTKMEQIKLRIVIKSRKCLPFYVSAYKKSKENETTQFQSGIFSSCRSIPGLADYYVIEGKGKAKARVDLKRMCVSVYVRRWFFRQIHFKSSFRLIYLFLVRSSDYIPSILVFNRFQRGLSPLLLLTTRYCLIS